MEFMNNIKKCIKILELESIISFDNTTFKINDMNFNYTFEDDIFDLEGTNILTSHIIRNIYRNFNIIMILCENDNDIIEKFGINVYSILKFVILTNNTTLRPININSSANIFENKLDIYNDLLYFEIEQDIVKQNTFTHSKTDFLF